MRYVINNKEIRNICIIGAGNEGHYLMALLGSNPGLKVSVLTSNADNFQSEIACHNVQSGNIVKGKLYKVSTNPADVIPESDMIIFTVPSNGCEKYLHLIEPHIWGGG